MQCRGIRGAITIPANNKEDIVSGSKELLAEMTQVNKIEIDDVAAIFFTTTADLNVEFPAVATRELGWPHYMALICGHEMDVPHDISRCLRILMLVNTTKKSDEIIHVYLKGAKKLEEKKTAPRGDDR